MQAEQRHRTFCNYGICGALDRGGGYKKNITPQWSRYKGGGISTNVYGIFTNRADAFRAACDEAFEHFFERAMGAAMARETWPAKIEAAARIALELAEREPAEGSACPGRLAWNRPRNGAPSPSLT